MQLLSRWHVLPSSLLKRKYYRCKLESSWPRCATSDACGDRVTCKEIVTICCIILCPLDSDPCILTRIANIQSARRTCIISRCVKLHCLESHLHLLWILIQLASRHAMLNVLHSVQQCQASGLAHAKRKSRKLACCNIAVACDVFTLPTLCSLSETETNYKSWIVLHVRPCQGSREQLVM